MPEVQRPLGRDITKRNPVEFIYLKGDDLTDGSLRLKPDVSNSKFEFQMRISSVWNDTDIQVANASIFIGKDLRLSGSGEWLQTFALTSNESSLIPHITYNDDGSFLPHAPVVGKKLVRLITQPIINGEFVGTSLTETFVNLNNFFSTKIYVRVGSIGATANFTYTQRRGGPSGPIVFQRNYPASLMATPGAEIELDFDGILTFDEGQTTHNAIESVNPISLQGDTGSGRWWGGADIQPFEKEDILQDNMILTDDLDFVFREDGSFVVNDVFPGGS